MKKKIIIFLSLIVIFILVLISIYFLSISDIKKDIKTEFGLIKGTEKEWSEAFKEYDIFQCRFGLFNSEYVFVSHRDYSFRNEDKEQWKTTFYHATRPHFFSINWQTEYTGGTTIKNTTFPQLVAMVKEDCSQFQGGFVNEDPDGIRWTHTRADTKEEKAESIRRVSYGKLKLFPEFIEVYGDIDEMTDDEVIALHEQIKEEGLDAKVQMADETNDLRKELLEITQEQRDQVKQTYGEWKDFTNEEFLEWIGVIKVDMESGKFVLIGK